MTSILVQQPTTILLSLDLNCMPYPRKRQKNYNRFLISFTVPTSLKAQPHYFNSGSFYFLSKQLLFILKSKLSHRYPTSVTQLTLIVICKIWLPLFQSLFYFYELYSLDQRLFNDLYRYRARLSRGHMIWLLAHPIPPSPVSKLNRRYTGRLRKRDNLLMGEGVRGGVGEEPNFTTAEKLCPQ